ncbi:hypothetical protein KW497_10210 [Vibrio fluvialis]|nr:hypothetical protein [Vibrio fluvialis]EKO3420960.1 hypothetical protein [Vibrio fluvialis]EKO3521901.1 hypothetical protein [Vibrio fluvialis]EKO3528919.1 hypothetical protein [Vibrio fluvialis]EKO3530241.1 hypothetical protein [Vibrio fluvialis]
MSFIGSDEDKTRGIWEAQANKQAFFTATKNFVANPENAQYVQTLNDPNASLEQKQQAQQVLVNNIAAQMKVDPAVVLQAMTTDEQNSSTKGGYINGGNTLYVNGDMHDTIQDEANTVGHEMQHYLDDKAGTTAGNDTAKQNLENFANTMGSATEDFLGFNYGNLTDTTFGGDISHTSSTNVPGSGVLLDTNTNQFNQAKEQGELENRLNRDETTVLINGTQEQKNDMNRLDYERDQAMNAACQDMGSPACQSAIASAQNDLDSFAQGASPFEDVQYGQEQESIIRELNDPDGSKRKEDQETLDSIAGNATTAAAIGCSVISWGACATVAGSVEVGVESVDYIIKSWITNEAEKDSPILAKPVLGLVSDSLSNEIDKLPLSPKWKAAAQTGNAAFGYITDKWADKAEEVEKQNEE